MSHPDAHDPARNRSRYPTGPSDFDDLDRAKSAHSFDRLSPPAFPGAAAPPADAAVLAAPVVSPPTPRSPPPVRASPIATQSSSCPRTYSATPWATTLDAPTSLW